MSAENDSPHLERSEGMGRLAYFLCLLGVIIIPTGLDIAYRILKISRGFENLWWVGLFLFLYALASAYRVKNMGYNSLVGVISIVPLLGVLFAFWCLAMPENYRYKRKLDVPGIVIVSLYGLALLALIVAFVSSRLIQ